MCTAMMCPGRARPQSVICLARMARRTACGQSRSSRPAEQAAATTRLCLAGRIEMDRRIAVCPMAGVLAVVAISGSAAWAGNPKQLHRDSQALEGPVVSIVEAQNRVAFDLYGRLAADGQDNLFFSPASISMALAMTYAGAAENTEAEMAKTLHLNLPKAQVAEAMKALRQSWSGNGSKQGYRLDVANRLWGQAGYKFLPHSLEVARLDYWA